MLTPRQRIVLVRLIDKRPKPLLGAEEDRELRRAREILVDNDNWRKTESAAKIAEQ